MQTGNRSRKIRVQESRMNVTQVPRSPFLPQSERLLAHLLRHAEQPGSRVLEVGCGEASCLVPYLANVWPEATLDQIDARPEVIPVAQERNATGTVYQMNIADMSEFGDQSFDAIIAMSVFDQNPLSSMSAIAKEMNRVLRPGGIVAYIHNEEVNAPAASASAAALDPPTCLLPNDRWRPDNDLEYCSASIADTRRGLAQLGPEFDMLRQYLEVFHPTPEQLRQNGGKIQVPLVRQLTIPAMAKLRSLVRELRAHVELVDCSSPSLLTERIEQHLLQAGHGFEVVESGMFELWRRQKWSDIFKVRPDEKYFVRNVAKFGYSATERPTPMPGYVQELAEAGDPSDDEVMLVSYQYGAAARKSA